jgi:hypothetical protein
MATPMPRTTHVSVARGSWKCLSRATIVSPQIAIPAAAKKPNGTARTPVIGKSCFE